MRFAATSANGDFRARAICGTRTVLMALDCPAKRLAKFRGFSFYRESSAGTGKWLYSQKVFRSIVPDPSAEVNGRRPVFTSERHPVQSFLWSDYTAEPGSHYVFRIEPRYGNPRSLKTNPDDVIVLTIDTESEDDPSGHGIWFNRGAIASQHFAREFGDIQPSTQQLEDLTQPVTRWLSRGLVEACLAHINETPAGDGLRACVYEFTYKPVLNALKAAIDRGVDVRITYHDTAANRDAIGAAEIPSKSNGHKILFPRTVPKIPHNKFIVRLESGSPTSVWTGSTNITSSGFLGQSNVGHKVRDGAVAATYLGYWEAISKDPASPTAKKASTRLTPHPPELPAKDSISVVFSPRHRATMLEWYANRMTDACQSVMFTAAFGVNAKLILPLAQDRDFLRFVLMESRPSSEVRKALRADRDLIISYGAVLGEVARIVDGSRKTTRIRQFGLDQWFAKEEHYRKAGNIFFVHTKFLLVDPLSDDPLVCTGSANFSDGSLTSNDENMLLIRGDKRVADIYLTEFDRIFRHFYFRDVANEIESRGGDAQGAFLDESDDVDSNWTKSYFNPGAFKTRRREMFFAAGTPTWTAGAARRPADETAKVGDVPTRRASATKKAGGKRAPK